LLSLAKAAGIRSGEGRLLALVAMLFGALEAGRGFGEVGVDTLVISRFGAGTLPYLFIGLGATSLVTALAYGAALGRVARTPLLVGIVSGAAGLLIVGRLVMAGGTGDVVPLIWLVTYAAGTIAGTISWTVASSVFDARQAKRLFPLCTGAAIAGSFAGTLASGPTARAAGTETLVLVEAILLAVVALLVVAIARTGRVRVPARRRDRSVVADVRVGLDEVLRSPLFRLVALAYVLFSILYFSVTYPFLQAAATTFPTEADLATAIGLLSAAVTATSFVVSLTIANRVYARLGVATAALALPLVYVGAFALWLVQFSFATAALVRFTQQVTQRGVSNAAWSAFYNVIPTERRAQVLAFIDGVPGQLGTILSGLLLLAAGRLFAAEQVFWLGLVTAIAVTVVVVAIRRRYAASLLRTLRAGFGEQVLEGGPGIAALGRDPQVAAALTVALRAPEPTVRRMAVEMLSRIEGAGVFDALVMSLGDDDPAVRAAALAGLAEHGSDASISELIVERLEDTSEAVRAAAIRALGGLRTERTDELVRQHAQDPSLPVRAAVAVALDGRDGQPGSLAGLLADPSAEVRHAAIQAIAAVGGLARSETIAPTLLAALDDDSPQVRRTAASLLSSRDDDTDGVAELLSSGSPRAQDAALLALVRHGAAVREGVVRWAEAQITRATMLRSARSALERSAGVTGAPPHPMVDFLAAVLRHRERRLTDRALGALSVLGAPEAGGVLRRCLRSGDQEVRAQAMEALDSIGDRILRRAIVRLLDADTPTQRPDRERTLHELADDDDSWISALARRAITEAGGATQMADTARTLSDIDTMLMLRRVPLFEGLEPEDLQRIATSCIERFFPTGSALVTENELGGELFVIASGSVRVVHAQEGGGELFIRRYEAGDHIGELAVLLERPRVATVIADEDVRALVIEGESLKAILRERPEAAMAMLATLAKRISLQ
jgi:HEAT repeat protein/ATP/ADP translocase